MLKIKTGMPVQSQLASEGISFTEHADYTFRQIAILNIMPNKQDTERQLLRLLGTLPADIEVTFLYPESHEAKNTDHDYLKKYYTTFSQIKALKYDALIITGAPVETLEYEDVNYIDEVKDILEWSKTHTEKRLFLCWSAQYALYHDYGIEKVGLSEKLFGLFPYILQNQEHPIAQSLIDNGIEELKIPASRHTQIDIEHLKSIEDLDILAAHDTHGPDIIASKDLRTLYIFGHLEYEAQTLGNEFHRDLAKGITISAPENYYQEHTKRLPHNTWHSQAVKLYQSWLNAHPILIE